MNNLTAFLVRVLSEIYIHLPTPGIRNPVFIVGCARSGTTILGKALSMHPAITYLHEPRNLWHKAYPETYIWIEQAELGTGKLVFTEADVVPTKTRKLSRLFAWETLKRGKPVLVEKLPINSFRLLFIQKMFPDAKYIHILRDGVEVAKSMDKLVLQKKWMGSESYKWKLLTDLAKSAEDTKLFLEFHSDVYEHGLLEWRLSVESWLGFSHSLPEQSFYEITYDELVAKPVDVIRRCLQFLNLETNPIVDKFARNTIRRQSMRSTTNPLTDRESLVAGDLLRSVRKLYLSSEAK